MRISKLFLEKPYRPYIFLALIITLTIFLPLRSCTDCYTKETLLEKRVPIQEIKKLKPASTKEKELHNSSDSECYIYTISSYPLSIMQQSLESGERHYLYLLLYFFWPWVASIPLFFLRRKAWPPVSG